MITQKILKGFTYLKIDLNFKDFAEFFSRDKEYTSIQKEITKPKSLPHTNQPQLIKSYFRYKPAQLKTFFLQEDIEKIYKFENYY
jgi:hypothetical protein